MKMKNEEILRKGIAAIKGEKPKTKRGRPSKYSPDAAAQICAIVASGDGLPGAAEKLEINLDTIYAWEHQHPDFSEALARAKKIRASGLGEKYYHGLGLMLENALKKKNGSVVSALSAYLGRLQWMMSKADPQTYGDKQTLEMTGANGTPLHQSTPEQMQELAERIAAARQRIIDQAREKGRPLPE